MRSALYFPYTAVQSESLVKTALLLWDRLDHIVPWDHFEPHYRTRGISHAMELIGGRHRPNDEEKRDAHERLKEILSRRIPPQLYVRQRRKDSEELYDIYPEKLFPESWSLLRKAELARKTKSNSDYSMTEFGGLMLMSILADSCAGTTRSRITDRGDAYATLASLFGNKPKAPQTPKSDKSEQLVPISLEIIDAPSLSIEALIKLREREHKESGHTLRDLRHRYVDALEKYLTRLTREKVTKSDAIQIQKEFADDMKADLNDLRKEIGFARREAVLSKEVLVTATAAVGSVASWLWGAPFPLQGVIEIGGTVATIGGLLASENKYLKARHEILRKHPMAYLYEAQSALR